MRGKGAKVIEREQRRRKEVAYTSDGQERIRVEGKKRIEKENAR